MPNPTHQRATRTAPTRTNDARTAHPGNRAHRAPTRAPLPETKRARVRAPTTGRVSLTSLVTFVHNKLPLRNQLLIVYIDKVRLINNYSTDKVQLIINCLHRQLAINY